MSLFFSKMLVVFTLVAVACSKVVVYTSRVSINLRCVFLRRLVCYLMMDSLGELPLLAVACSPSICSNLMTSKTMQ